MLLENIKKIILWAEKLIELHKLPRKVRWFDSDVLMNALKRAVLSGTFGSYADRRLTQAALDHKNDTQPINLQNCSSNKDEIWIDYVADLGDGFDSTYAVAYLLAQKQLTVDGYTLPRANLLIMGGDQVYPTPSRDEYKNRLDLPYKYAFPLSENGEHPYVCLIPGNHDWYDGLTLFLAKYCLGKINNLGKDNHFGGSSWRLCQTRSYFAIELDNNWQVWGIDTQLGDDIDQPQANYFIEIAKKLKNTNAKILLCTSVPSWLYDDTIFYRGIDSVYSDIIRNHCPDAKIYAVLAGDLHNYNRYLSDDKTNFITAGGGGAFLHPTHHLKDTITDRSIFSKNQALHLKTCFPSKCKSRILSIYNLLFPIFNFKFSLVLGFFYSIIAFILMLYSKPNAALIFSTNNYSWLSNIQAITCNPIFVAIAVCLWIGLYKYALHEDLEKSRFEKSIFSIGHTLFHLAGIVIQVMLLSSISSWLIPIISSFLPAYFDVKGTSIALSIIFIVFTGALWAGLTWGIYLFSASFIRSKHFNDAFGTLSLTGYKNFLRMCIKNNTLTIYSIGLKTPPKRWGWKWNKNAIKGNQNESIIIPKKQMKPILIEDPIRIDFNTT